MLNANHLKLTLSTLIKLLAELKSLFLLRCLQGLMPHLRCHLFGRNVLVAKEFISFTVCADQETVESVTIG